MFERQLDYEAILARFDAGCSTREMATEFGVPRTSINHICRKFRPSRLVRHDRELIAAKIREGKSFAEIKAETGASRTTVKRIARETETPTSFVVHKFERKWTDELDARLLVLAATEATRAEIGQALGGFSDPAVWKRFKFLTGTTRPDPVSRRRKRRASIVPKTDVPLGWNEEQVNLARQLWDDGLIPEKIGERIGKSRSAIVRLVERNAWPKRDRIVAAPKRVPVTRAAVVRPKPVAAYAVLQTPRIVTVAPEPPVPVPVLLSDVGCIYPLDDPSAPRGYRYCDDPALPGKDYCPDHYRLCYVVPAHRPCQPDVRRTLDYVERGRRGLW